MKKVLSVFLALVLVLSCALPTFAVSAEQETANAPRILTISSIPKILASIHENITVALEDFDLDFKDFKAEYDKRGFESAAIKLGVNVLNVLTQALLRGVLDAFADPVNWKNIEDYNAEAENIYFGRDTYQTQAQANAEWKLGYASASVLPDDVGETKYSVGRSLVITSFFGGVPMRGATAESVLDDQRVRVIAVDDGTGEGAVIIAVIDGIGVGSGTIRAIREKLTPYVESGKVSSINISATHSHTALDTQGVSTPFIYALIAGLSRNAKENPEKYPTYNDTFMENLVDTSAETIETAINNMEPGKLYYDTADASGFVYDKRYEVEDVPPVGILRFDPTNAQSKETYLANISCHPTIANSKNCAVSADYIYYLDKNFQMAGHNFIFVQGAVGQLSASDGASVISNEELAERIDDYDITIDEEYRSGIESRVRQMIGLADDFSSLILSAKADGEEELAPVINAKHQEITFTTSNYLLRLACQMKLVDNVIYRSGDGVDEVMLPSEVGYVEFGNRMAFGLYPAELYPEVFHGDVTGADESWSGEEWTYDSMPDYVKKNLSANIDLYAMCFANDYIGYVVPDTYYAFFGHIIPMGDNTAWGGGNTGNDEVMDEILSAGKGTASNIVETFQTLIDNIK